MIVTRMPNDRFPIQRAIVDLRGRLMQNMAPNAAKGIYLLDAKASTILK